MNARMMMKIAATALLMVAGVIHAQADTALLNEARVQTKQLAQQLQKTLKRSMQADGPVAAISVCNIEAPQIAAGLSTGDWQVGRTALKIRNPANAANDWEVAVMQSFSEQLSAGVDPKTLEASKQEGDNFYYMKAIATGPVCLACHGENIAQPLAEKLDQLYPQDQARGFRQGQLRGAFTLIKTLK